MCIRDSRRIVRLPSLRHPSTYRESACCSIRVSRPLSRCSACSRDPTARRPTHHDPRATRASSSRTISGRPGPTGKRWAVVYRWTASVSQTSSHGPSRRRYARGHVSPNAYDLCPCRRSVLGSRYEDSERPVRLGAKDCCGCPHVRPPSINELLLAAIDKEARIPCAQLNASLSLSLLFRYCGPPFASGAARVGKHGMENMQFVVTRLYLVPTQVADARRVQAGTSDSATARPRTARQDTVPRFSVPPCGLVDFAIAG